MKKYYVYELINLMGTVEYVGRTYRPNGRLRNHTKHKPVENYTGQGMFYGRQDLIMNIVAEFDELKEASIFECELKTSYGMECTEINNSRRNGKKVGLSNSQPVLVYKKDGTFVGEYYSGREAERRLELASGTIASIFCGKQKTTKEYIIKKK